VTRSVRRRTSCRPAWFLSLVAAIALSACATPTASTGSPPASGADASGSAPFASVAVVYLTGSALGSIVPTPGGLGAVEAALTAGLRAAGVAGGVAVSGVLLFRLLTFWLPVPAGWAALKYLERQQLL